MNLKDYLSKNNLKANEFRLLCLKKAQSLSNPKLYTFSLTSIYNYLSGKCLPSQRAAEIIEDITHGEVSVFELRGKDDRHNFIG